MATEKDKLDEILNLLNENNKKIKELESKINCKECKEVDPLSKNYFFKHLFTKKFFVNFTWRMIVKTTYMAILVILVFDYWYPFVDGVRRSIPWNNPEIRIDWWQKQKNNTLPKEKKQKQ